MKAGSIWAWIMILLGSLGLAYWASLPRPEVTESVIIQNLHVNDVDRLELKTSSGQVLAVRQKDRRDRWWITVQPTPMSGREGGTQTKGEDQFLASDQFKDYLRKLAGLAAQREIVGVEEQSLKDFGLADGASSFTLKNAAGDLLAEFVIGKQPYGARTIYIMRKSDRKIFIVASNMIEDFSRPESRFFERKLTDFALEDAQTIKLESAGKTKLFVRMKQDEDGVPQWASGSASGSKVTAAGVWFEKFRELKAASYASESLRQAILVLEPTLQLTFADAKGGSALVTVRRYLNGDTAEYYVSTDYLGWPVKVASARADNLIKDLPMLFKD